MNIIQRLCSHFWEGICNILYSYYTFWCVRHVALDHVVRITFIFAHSFTQSTTVTSTSSIWNTSTNLIKGWYRQSWKSIFELHLASAWLFLQAFLRPIDYSTMVLTKIFRWERKVISDVRRIRKMCNFLKTPSRESP